MEMKKIIVGLLLIFPLFILNSCNDWEDESYHPGGSDGPEVIMLLKESTQNYANGITGKYQYTYDSENRLSKILIHMDTSITDSYSEATYSYSGNTHVDLVVTTYMFGMEVSKANFSSDISGNTQTTNIEHFQDGESIGTMISVATFSAPCGITENTVTTNFPGFPPMQSTATYEYTDSNCSYKEMVDGTLATIVTNDDKFSPIITGVEDFIPGYVRHNPIKIENQAENIVETITYTYNENDYPETASHTFSDEGMNYTETFTYY